MKINYQKFIESRLTVINKEGEEVPFFLNNIQKKYQELKTQRDIILKARQQGFSSLILAEFTANFLFMENSHSVVVADESENAIGLLDRVKYYLKAYEYRTGQKVPLKYNSRYELYNEDNNSKYTIGTAKNVEFGRSKTISNLHFSEAAFYPQFEKIRASALQALTPNGRCVIETTANGFNQFKDFWDEAVAGKNDFNPLFFKASDFYDKNFLKKKKSELGRLFRQEYPETPQEAFLTSGDCYFDTFALFKMMGETKDPMEFQFLI